MLFFVNSKQQVLFVKSSMANVASFSFPELDADSFNALVTTVRITPKPVYGIQGTVGGANFINIFGEDPLQVEIGGLIVGSNCNSANTAQSAIGNSVAFYRAHGIINRAAPIKFVLHGSGQKERQAFLVAMTVSQEDSFNDIVQFQMMLLGENLDSRTFSKPTKRTSTTTGNLVVGNANTGLASQVSQTATAIASLAVAANNIDSSGAVITPALVSVTGNSLALTTDSIRKS